MTSDPSEPDGSTPRQNPFPGLRPFEANDTHLFFGREGQSEDILRSLRRSRLLAVVGASGSGKSSLVRAGLLPHLHGGFFEQAGSHWRVALLRPGGDPIEALAHALVEQSVLATKPDEAEEIQRHTQLMAAQLRRSGLGLVEAVRLARPAPAENVLVVIDQFEELFRFGHTAGAAYAGDDAAAFVKLILEATRQDKLPIYACLTMRSDFIGECARFRDLPEAVAAGLYLIPRMTRAQRRAAIEQPVRVGGGHITPRLVTRILNDVGDDPDQLPIMQHALMRAWDHWQAGGEPARPIDLSDYEAIGGTANALSMHADEAYGGLGERDQTIARKMFQRLTEKDADNREARRPTLLSVLAEVAEVPVDNIGEDRRRVPRARPFLPHAPDTALAGHHDRHLAREPDPRLETAARVGRAGGRVGASL
jgi:energy-coupling factor transporter ATP-binding protein EcfA2